jgi:hypothetical protein
VMIWQDASEASYYYSVGNWSRAETLATSFLAAVQGSTHYQEPIVRFVRAHIRYARGDVAGAFDDAELGTAAAHSAADPQAIAVSTMHATLLVHEGRIEAASTLLDEVLSAGFSDYYLALDFALNMAALGRGEELAARLGGADFGDGWLNACRALAVGDLAGAADSYAELGLATYEAYARLRAAEGFVAVGRRSDADEQLGRALAFYRSVGATRYVREGEALLAASA